MIGRNKRIFLSPPHMGGTEHIYVADAFATNWIAPLGPHVNAFESEIAEYVGITGAAALNSGTAAIHLALKCIGVGRGDLVFCSSFTFAASANPIVYEGATPVFIDSEPDSWNMSPDALARAIDDSVRYGVMPKAVIVVNLYGQSADMDRLLEICAPFSIPVIEDAAESLGSTYKGKASGTLGQFGVYSFNGNKIITTSGGGMLVSEDLEALEKVRFWATQARDPARHYQHSEIGYNYRLSNISAAIGRGQLRVLDERVARRRQIFARYFAALSAIPGIEFMPEARYGHSNRWLTALTIDSRRTRETATELMDTLADNDIESRPVWKPLHLQPIFNDCAYYPHSPDESICDGLFEQGICLPSGSSLTDDDQDRVIDIVASCLSRQERQAVSCY